MLTANYSFHSIAGAYMLGLAPHAIFTLKMLATKKFSNVAPRENFETVKDKLAPNTRALLTRLRGAHLNAMEGFPLFAAAMIAGNVVGLPADFLNKVATQYLVSRVLYTAFYTCVDSELMSYLRTGVWAFSVYTSISALLQAGKAVM